MEPTEVRQTIKNEHVALRTMLDELESAIAGGGIEEVHAKGVALLEKLEVHLDLEDRLLVPALRQAGPWGVKLADQVEKHHRIQRTELRTTLDRCTDAPATEINEMLTKLIGDLRIDMEHEDSELLDPNLLSDNVFALIGGA